MVASEIKTAASEEKNWRVSGAQNHHFGAPAPEEKNWRPAKAQNCLPAEAPPVSFRTPYCMYFHLFSYAFIHLSIYFHYIFLFYLCKKYKSNIILRGLRAVSDFEYEFQLAGMNRKLNNNIETIFLMSDVENQIISSKFVKEIASLGGNINRFVTKSTVVSLAPSWVIVIWFPVESLPV